ncbi:alpha-L-rhamnosidase C-terminal domain-containing protein [Flavisphingomonas formosensis]|uniref:alpha-L-rhamnosidase C-terminal domain-containing protein n=1 Tax=Flavisphingomonas formosensis TaxID=861534 RepID=UPI0018E02F7C
MANADYLSAAGLIKTDWRFDGDELTLAVELPPNVSGEVTLPGTKRQIRRNRLPLPSTSASQRSEGGTQIDIGPGRSSRRMGPLSGVWWATAGSSARRRRRH